MALRPAILLLLLALPLLSNASADGSGAFDREWAIAHISSDDEVLAATSRTCDGLVGECIDPSEEMDMESEISRRGLAGGPGRRRFISYGALAKNRVPCNRRGQSYYNCRKFKRVNPYRRGCTVITRCARYLY